jgi:Na+/H+ antiporter NhaD/arsenite permease-like protein
MYLSKPIMAALGIFFIFIVFITVLLSGTTAGVPEVPAIRAEFYLFAVTLLGVALFHEYTMYVALIGLASITTLKLGFDQHFNLVQHFFGGGEEKGEWRILLNLLGLLLGFAILAKHFEESKIPDILPRFLPDGWMGGFILLALVFTISTFLDNIAAAMIGGTIALVVFKGKVDIGYLAGIVAASNAGGAATVVGDTTTTMMWIAGVPASEVFRAFIAGVPALLVFGVILARKQHAYQPIQKDEIGHHKIDWTKIGVVALILAGAIAANFLLGFPAAGVWAAILLGAVATKTPWKELSNSIKGTIFLLSLVTCASMMPVEELPKASWVTAFMLGAISAVFDNIPLTALAIKQDGYDWAVLAYCVGFGGSMIWFGSSAGVALTNQFPHAKSVGAWIRHGWAVALAYVIGFAVLMLTLGWEPDPIASFQSDTPPAAQAGPVTQSSSETAPAK